MASAFAVAASLESCANAGDPRPTTTARIRGTMIFFIVSQVGRVLSDPASSAGSLSFVLLCCWRCSHPFVDETLRTVARGHFRRVQISLRVGGEVVEALEVARRGAAFAELIEHGE